MGGEKESRLYISMAATKPSKWYFALSINRAVADMCEELTWEISKCSEGTGTRSTERFGDHGNAKRIVDNKSTPSDR